MKPRGPDGTLQTRVWLALRKRGPATAQEIADDLSLEREGVRKAIYYLIQRGKAKKRRAGATAMIYTALGAQPPQDMRGKMPGCRNRARNIGRVWQMMMKAKHGANWKPKPAQDSHPLAQALRLTP